MERTLLLVDDEEEIGAALARLLKQDGYRILRAKSGEEGFALLAQNKVGVILSDQRMPEMTGIEFLTQVKELYPDTIRIILSGYADLDAVMDATNRSAIFKFFTKPWDNETLRAEIMSAFRHHELILERAQLIQEIQAANELLANANQEWLTTVAQRNSQINLISNYSPLTDLPNRQFFIKKLEQEITHAQHDNNLLAVLYMNLDQFKQVNDSFGYQMGDLLLQAVAKRLAMETGPKNTLAHMGADEFAFIIPNIGSAQTAAKIAQQMMDLFTRAPIPIGNNEVFVTACIGASFFPLDGVNANMLLKNADAAMHCAKNESRGNFQYYTKQMNATSWQRLALETELRHALERNEFELYYQPKVELANGKMVGMEALLRWNSPGRGLVYPSEFVPVLEETSLILPVGEWILATACKQACAWQQPGYPPIRIAINISAIQFHQSNLSQVIQDIFRENSLDQNLGLLEFEMTESLLMKDADGTIAILNTLHGLGIRLSIDDFGTGYSNLSYLKKFPINAIKIDQSFIRNILNDRNDMAIVNAVVAMGHNMGLKVIAEGVETFEQMNYLQGIGCDEVQGFLFSRPMPSEEMSRLLQNVGTLNMLDVAVG